jgi:ribosomal subunit interface protein
MVSTKPTVVISFKDIPVNDPVRELLELGTERLAAEFPETTRFEFTLAPDGTGHTAHARVTGSGNEVDSHAQAVEVGQAADKLLDKLERQLRRVHEKRIFSPRRDAQKDNPKRKPS